MRILRWALIRAAQRGHENAKQSARFLIAVAALTMAAGLVPAGAQAACAGICGEDQASTGLANPPGWAEGRKVHFEPETVKASAYSEKELEGEGGPLLYNESGNGVQHTPKVFLVLWGSNF